MLPEILARTSPALRFVFARHATNTRWTRRLRKANRTPAWLRCRFFLHWREHASRLRAARLHRAGGEPLEFHDSGRSRDPPAATGPARRVRDRRCVVELSSRRRKPQSPARAGCRQSYPATPVGPDHRRKESIHFGHESLPSGALTDATLRPLRAGCSRRRDLCPQRQSRGARSEIRPTSHPVKTCLRVGRVRFVPGFLRLTPELLRHTRKLPKQPPARRRYESYRLKLYPLAARPGRRSESICRRRFRRSASSAPRRTPPPQYR